MLLIIGKVCYKNNSDDDAYSENEFGPIRYCHLNIKLIALRTATHRCASYERGIKMCADLVISDATDQKQGKRSAN